MHHVHYKKMLSRRALRLQCAGYALQVDIDSIEAGPHKSIPWIDPFKMMTCLAETDKLHLLHGDHDLMEFWRRFAKVQPNHRVFDLAAGGSLKLGSTIPIYSHGDEGRGKKKKAS